MGVRVHRNVRNVINMCVGCGNRDKIVSYLKRLLKMLDLSLLATDTLKTQRIFETVVISCSQAERSNSNMAFLICYKGSGFVPTAIGIERGWRSTPQ